MASMADDDVAPVTERLRKGSGDSESSLEASARPCWHAVATSYLRSHNSREA